MKDYNKIRVGILGMGGMGCKYARLMMEGKVPGMELAAVTRICRDQRGNAKPSAPKCAGF